MILYTYWRSTAAYRVRIGLNMKGVEVEQRPIHLVRGGGEQHRPEYRAVNPAGVVPSLVLDDGTILTQSLAILEYLDEWRPAPGLLPADPVERAQVRAAAQQIASDIHPINNLRVAQYLRNELGHDQDAVTAWMNHWMEEGLSAFQALISSDSPFCFGDRPGLADICLVPQLYNARRWGTNMSGLERLLEIEGRCLDRPAFADAAPEPQSDAER